MFLFLGNLYILVIQKSGYIPFRSNASLGAIRRILTVAFLIFQAPAGGSNLAGQSLT